MQFDSALRLNKAYGIVVIQRRKFAGGMRKKPVALDRKSGADKWWESISNANINSLTRHVRSQVVLGEPKK